MGNAFGRNGIFIELDQYSLYPGDTLTGNIQINVVDSVSIRSIDVEIVGFEETRWTETRKAGATNNTGSTYGAVNAKNTPLMGEEVNPLTGSVTETHGGRHEFFRQTFPAAVDMNLRAGFIGYGQYTVPFQMQLPSGLPGSCEVGVNPNSHGYQKPNFGEDFWAVCQYELRVTARTDDSADFCGERKLNVLNIPPPPSNGGSKDAIEVTNCFNCSVGECSIEMQENDGSFRIGEMISATGTIRNTSSKDLSHLHLELVRYITLRSCNGKVLESRATVCTMENVMHSVAAGESTRDTFRMKVPEEIESFQFDEKEKRVVPTTHGGMLDVSYKLVLSGSMGWCASQKPQTTLPVTMFSSNKQLIPEVPEVSQWNPEMLPMIYVPAFNVTYSSMQQQNMPYYMQQNQVPTYLNHSNLNALNAGYNPNQAVLPTTTIQCNGASAGMQAPIMQAPMACGMQAQMQVPNYGSTDYASGFNADTGYAQPYADTWGADTGYTADE
jgi:hypothetical protein